MRIWPCLLLALSACGAAPTLQEMYSGPWTDPSPAVIRTLAANGVRGCGEAYQKANTRYEGEFAVACTRTPDGSPAWVVYLVWTGRSQVVGPDLTAAWTIGGPPHHDPQ